MAEGALQAQAGRDIQIGTANASGSARDQVQRSSSGILSAKTVRTDDASSFSRQLGSTLSGNAVLVRAGQDVKVTGSDVVSTQGTAVVAGRDVNIASAIDSSTRRSFRQETTSGVMGAGLGVTIGTREQSHDGKTQGQTAAASTIGSVEGNVTIVAGNRYTQVGSDVLAPKGDIDIAARSVEIRAAEQASRTTTEDKFKQSGVTLAITSPVISAMQSVEQMADAASKTKSGRAQALAAATAGMSVYSAAGEMQKAGSEGSPSIGISATIGSSQNGSRSEQNTVTQRGATVASGGNMSIRATGDGANSNITIAGSDINAKGNLALKADNDINLIAAQNSDEQHSTRSSSSWGVGITAQIGSQSKLGITANAAGSRGKSDGKDVSNVMTQVRAGGQVNINSGRDTNLIGATVSGEQVVANVGRDLNIASVQDTSTFKSRDQSVGGSATIGYGSGASISASRSRVDADYASVGQQAGIMAGNGGFQINVKGNTDLKGAQIASTDQSVEQGRNSLTTGTLTSSDIQNRSQYSAESQSASVGTSGGKPGGGIGIGNASGSETSVTRSGVSGAAVTITDAQAQQARTGQSSDQAVASLDASVRTGKDSSNSLSKSWDGNQLREDVEAQAKITQAFGQQASTLIGNYAEEQQKKAADLRKQAADTSDPQQAKELNDQASALESKWGPDGKMRVLAHSIVGGLTGGLAGAAGAAAGTLTAPNVASALDKAGVDPDLAKALTGLSSALVGAAVGGTVGGAAAYNEVVNNYLKHEEDEQRLKKKAACATSADPSSCRREVEKAYNQIGRSRQQRTCSDADSCRENRREIEEDLQNTTARQLLLERRLYQGKLTDDEKAEYFSNGQQIQLMQAALQEANRQFRAMVPLSQWTLRERDTAFSDAMTAIGGLGASAAIGRARGANDNASAGKVTETDQKTINTSPSFSTNPKLKLGESTLIDGVEFTRVGRWMSTKELAIMQQEGGVVQGAGGQTYVSVNGASDYKSSARAGSVYVEFDVPTSSLLQGGKEGWFKMIGPDASKSQKYLLNKQNGELLPKVLNIQQVERK
ncbi:filamentous hemagglutinin outer membrane protein [Herbaspirillum rubrisubalbicans M1]|nr:hemagglutinin repeat-containing protein [Herbaspirillum rubrisubalbicans]ALU91789.1 filamentous hemagglutinin outer membrane protein [Herbaspirillum rubrisubalbicans M1]